MCSGLIPSYLGCLGQCVSSMLVVSEREEGVVALHLAIWAVCLGHELVVC